VGDIGRLLELLADPVAGESLRHDGDESRGPDGRAFPRDGIPRFVGALGAAQQQTSDTFGFKWAKEETYDSPELHTFALGWMLEQYGFASALEARGYFEAGTPFLDHYAPPQAAWLRGPLCEWAEDLLGSQRFAEREWTDAAAVRGTWRAFRDGKDQLDGDLWRFLSVEAWSRTFLDR
jgi:hypothetical protein